MAQSTVNEVQLQAFLTCVAKARSESDSDNCIAGRSSIQRLLPFTNVKSEKLRLGYVLDSLANLCAREHKEVVAVALKWSRSRRNEDTIELLISTNSNVPMSTIEHLETVWQMMRKLSAVHHQKKCGSRRNINSPQKADPAQFDAADQEVEDSFRFLILAFSWKKLCRRANAKFDKFRLISTTNLEEGHFFLLIAKFVGYLEADYTREHNPRTGKPTSRFAWNHFWDLIRMLKTLVDGFKITDDVLSGVPPGFNLQRWLLKLTSVARDIAVLLCAARSPRCRMLFRSATFVVSPLRQTVVQPSGKITLPQTFEAWLEVVEFALKRSNELRKDSEDEKETDKHLVADSIERILGLVKEGTISSTDTVVHCECRIICQIVEGLQRFRKNAYGYIGVSKPSCYACQEFIQAVSKVHGINLLTTKPCHYKWFYPWPFPHIDRAVEIGTLMHDNAAATYEGFRVKERDMWPVNVDSDDESLDQVLARLVEIGWL